MEDLQVNATCTIASRFLVWTATRSGGPGGQNVNKVSSKVDLRFDLAGCDALHSAVKARLRTAHRNRFDAEGWLILTSTLTRDQHKNLEDVRQKLADFVGLALIAPIRRKATKPTKGSVRRRLATKGKQSEKKQGRKSPVAD